MLASAGVLCASCYKDNIHQIQMCRLRKTGVVPVGLEAKSGLILTLSNRIAFSTKTGLSLYAVESVFYKTTPLWLHKKDSQQW